MRPRQPLPVVADPLQAGQADSALLQLPEGLLMAVLDRVADVGADDPAASAERLAQSRFSEAGRATRELVDKWLDAHPAVRQAALEGPARKAAERARSLAEERRRQRRLEHRIGFYK
jgi:hypothetical protein